MNNKQQNQQQETKLAAPLPTQEKEMTEHKNELARVDEQSNVVPMVPQTEAAAMISMIERVVMDKDMPLDRLEKMIELKNSYDDRLAEKSFKEAFAVAKLEFKPIVKTRNGHNSKYADLFDLAEAVDEALSKHGFSYDFETGQDGNNISVTCIVSHKEGHSKRTTLSSGAETSGSKNAIQAMGSTVTYLERYTLSAALGLAAGQDTDGVKIDDKELIDDEQMQSLLTLISDTKTDTAQFCKFMKINNIKAMPLSKFGKAEKLLKAKLVQNNG